MFFLRKNFVQFLVKQNNLKNFSVKMMSQEISKKRKIAANSIGTHNGAFHCDEVLACFMIKQLPEFKESEIVRTRDSDILDQCEVVIDVGSEYNPATKRFDHHQKTFGENISTLRPDLVELGKVRLSSAGLIYVHYGERIIQEILKAKKGLTLDPHDLKTIFKKMYLSLIQEIDGIDNGIPMFEGEPLYNINSQLSNRVKYMNPNWMETKTDEEVDQLFLKAMDYAGNEMVAKLLYLSTVWLPGRSIVERAIENRFKTHSSGKIIELERYCPWGEHLHQIEKEQDDVNIYYVLYSNRENDHRVICVPVQPKSFVCRKFLHKKWRGIRDQELEAVSGIPGINFCHQNGFIGGHKTRDGSLKMAEISLLYNEDE